jgi:hypothetical protein
VAVKKLLASRDNMKGNSETQHRINGNSNSNGNEVQVLEEMTYFAVRKEVKSRMRGNWGLIITF